jgi:phosphomethylpyrimidine synthase
MCGPHFCSMKLTQDVRELAAAEAGMQERSQAFKEQGGAIYVPSDAAE